MKKREKLFLLVAVVVIGTFFFGSSASATIAEVRLERNSKGEVREVVESEKWRKLSKKEKEGLACAQPGKGIPINLRPAKPERKIRLNKNFFYMVPVQKYDKVVVCRIYNGDKKISTVEKHGALEGDKELATYIILLLVAMFFMAAFNIIVKKAIKSNSAVTFATAVTVTVVAAFATAVAAVAAFAFAFAAAAFAFAAAVAAVVAAVAGEDIKVYKVASVIFYILAGIALVV